MNAKFKRVLLVGVTFASACATAELMDRPVGVKIGQRMTLKPYVALSGTYDSNSEGRHDGKENFFWTVSPGFGLLYKAETWSLVANLQYQYNAYTRDRNGQQNYHGVTENLAYNWANSAPGERGWSLQLSQYYQRTHEDNNTYSGLEYGTDREAMNLSAALERRFGSGLHTDVNVSHYWLDYDNDRNQSSGLYGWRRTTAGLELGFAPSKWFDLLLSGSYQYYDQDNTDSPYYRSTYGDAYRADSSSQGETLQAGFGSFATDRISYRALAGWSRFEYGSADTADGFTYTVSGNWQITDTWKTMLLATSYYQPSEREYSSSQRVDIFSWGLTHAMVQGKLNGSLDIVYRHESPEYVWRDGNGGGGSSDYTLDSVEYRLQLDYILNRYLTLFLSGSYRNSDGSGSASSAKSYTYERYTGTLGVRFTY